MLGKMIRFIVLHFISFVKDIASFTRLPCNETNAVAELRYRVILSVSDGTGTAAFLGFDKIR